MKKYTGISFVAAATLTASLGLAACGGSKTSDSAAATSATESASAAATSAAASESASAAASESASAAATSAAATSAAATDATQSSAAASTPAPAATSAATTETTASAPEATSTPAAEPAPQAQPTTEDPFINVEAAKTAALMHAGFDEAAVSNLSVEADLDDAQPHYDVEFVMDGLEYDYVIDANTGEVLSLSSEPID